jgi:hypothetical protein
VIESEAEVEVEAEVEAEVEIEIECIREGNAYLVAFVILAGGADLMAIKNEK